MRFSTDFTIAINIILTCAFFKDEEKITAALIERKTGSDGTSIREVMYKLKVAGIIINKPGPGGTKLAKELKDITFKDVYKAISSEESYKLKFYKSPEDTKFSDAIQFTVKKEIESCNEAMLDAMAKIKLIDIYGKVNEQL